MVATTVGPGDLSPTSPWGRFLSSIVAYTGEREREEVERGGVEVVVVVVIVEVVVVILVVVVVVVVDGGEEGFCGG